MNLIGLIVFVLFCINIFLVIAMVFIERKKPEMIVSWLIVLTFLPILGFILYITIGSGLSYKTKRMLKNKRIYTKEYEEFISKQKIRYSDERSKPSKEKDYSELILFNLNNANSAYFKNNDVKVFTNGIEKIESLKKDLLSAKQSINLLYYIFADDEVGNEIMDILVVKARQGVKVKLLYDSVGCLKTKRSFFKRLEKAGGEVAEFFPPLFGLRLVNLKINYRNHRKIAVIDGKIAYTGGINIRDDHMGKRKKLSPWRDTHIRVVGDAVYGFATAFFNDWRFCKKHSQTFDELKKQGYFKKGKSKNSLGMQVVSSGPDLTSKPIKESFIRMILSAKEKLYIETPYFIPDEVVMQALNFAKASGVEINIIIPSLPDKMLVYMATLAHIKDVLTLGDGVNVYLYNGFIHSKAIMVDNKVVSVGSCNFDNRSFSLNFELNAYLYGKEICQKFSKIFSEDISNSKPLTKTFFKRKPWYSKIAQAFFRLFSPLL